MHVLENVTLADYSTMGLGGPAAYLVQVTSRQQVVEAVQWAQAKNLPVLMVGGGSNIIWKDEGYQGLVIINRIAGYDIKQAGGSYLLTVGAGEDWDSVVERSVKAGLTGIEALSLIPGTAGGTPVQNVGAYGQEISQTLVSVEAYDIQADDFTTLLNEDCDFSYRNSRFKATDRGRFLITSLTLKLSKGNPKPPFYGTVETYFKENKISDYTPVALRQAVVAIRSAKLPDPAKVCNTGSFFANPIIDKQTFDKLAVGHPDLAYWPVGEDHFKLSAAWLIEQAGFKDYHDQPTGMATWPRQPLVLVNERAKSTADLISFRNKIINEVKEKFGIELTQEPEMLP